jgi:hypothetical protein
LARAENDTVDALVRFNFSACVGRVLDDPLEVGVSGELFNVRPSEWVAEERLGEEEDKRLAELAVHLTSENVEQVRWLRAVRNLHVAVLVLAV